MSKRRLADDAADPGPSKVSRDVPDVNRRAAFRVHLTALNAQFATWVAGQNSNHPVELWADGVRDYLEHADKLLRDFKDVLDAEKPSIASGKAVQASKHVSFASTLPDNSQPAFGFASAASNSHSSAPASQQSTFSTPSPAATGPAAFSFGAAAAAATAASDGAPATSGPALFKFATQPSTAAAAPAAAGTATAAASSSAPTMSSSTGMFAFGSSAPSTTMWGSGSPGAAFGSGDSSKPAPASGLFTFGAPPTAAGPDAAAAPPSTSGGMFTFGAPPTAAGPDAAAAPPSTSGGMFTFGAAPSNPGSNAFSATFGSAGSSGAAPSEAEGEGDEDAPQKFESEVLTNEAAGEVVFKSNAKLQVYKKDAGKPPGWEPRGVGTLMIRTTQGGDGQPAKHTITWTTGAGKVPYVAYLPKVMNVVLNETRRMASWTCACNLDGVAGGQMVGFALPPGKHTELQALIQSLQKDMP